jgi:hypothetical protein
VALKSTVDEALASCPQVHTVFVSKRTGADIKIHPRYKVFFLVFVRELNIILHCVGSVRMRICIQRGSGSQKVELLTFFFLFSSNSYIFFSEVVLKRKIKKCKKLIFFYLIVARSGSRRA